MSRMARREQKLSMLGRAERFRTTTSFKGKERTLLQEHDTGKSSVVKIPKEYGRHASLIVPNI